jgi:hypothetical protein
MGHNGAVQAVRVFIETPAEPLDLYAVRGVDTARYRVFYAFGPAHVAVPLGTVRVLMQDGSFDDGALVNVRTYQDMAGVHRFGPTAPVPQMMN